MNKSLTRSLRKLGRLTTGGMTFAEEISEVKMVSELPLDAKIWDDMSGKPLIPALVNQARADSDRLIQEDRDRLDR